mmetsp:Transcript_10182/g.24353  ORF Transcript_10182/g.24353 Transcript_10182/m.24353 type:complete len:184 (-) Transcript_10182:3625-4176(-)
MAKEKKSKSKKPKAKKPTEPTETTPTERKQKDKKSGPPQFEEAEYDVSVSPCCWIASCPLVHYGFLPYKSILLLGPEEVKKTDVSICGKSEANMPYGELGHVGKSNCLCCVSLSSAFGEVSPGCGCDEALVDTVVADLKKRQEGRGDQGQVQRQEAMMEEIETINTKLDAIMDHLKMQQMERS